MKTKPCLFLILLLFSFLFPLGSFAQTDKFTASWTFTNGSSVGNGMRDCNGETEPVYVFDDVSDDDDVAMIVEANGTEITVSDNMVNPKTGVVLKIPVNKAGDKITVTKNSGKQCSYSIGITIYDIERYPINVTGNNASEEYIADELDAGVGYVEIKMLNDDNQFVKISVEMTKKTAYTYYDKSTETFYFLYDEDKYKYHFTPNVYNLNSQRSVEYYGENVYDTPHWNLGGYKKVVLTDDFIDYTNSDAGKLKSCNSWFQGCNLAYVEGLQNLNTSEVEDMRYMFYKCTYKIDENDPSIPTDLSTAFKNFDTKNVLDMGHMFEESFQNCKNIKLNLSSFEAPKVTNLLEMFMKSNIQTVDLSNFGGASVVEMRRMFSKCYFLESIDLSNWKSADGVSALTEYMFACVDGESQLKTVKLGKLNLSDRCAWMFKDCKNLKSVDMSQVNANKIIDMEYFFENCESLEDVDVSGTFEFDGPISLQGVFKNCKSLECLDLRTWKTKNVGSFNNFFTSNYIGQACEKLNTVFVSDGWSTEGELEKGNIMLYDCVNLIGGNGFTYKSIPLTDEMPDAEKNLATGTTYAHPDEEGNPGLFTYAPIGAELKYKIFYKLDGGKLPEGKSNPKEFAENDEVTLINPEKEGYVFAGWTGTSATKLTDKTIKVSFKNSRGNRWYYAHWEKGYSITFDTKFDDINIDPMLLKEKAPIDNLPEPSRAGYEFKGWKYGDNEVPKAMPAENITLTAQWKIINYTITLDYDGGKLPDGKTNPTTYTVETSTFTLEKPVKTGYSFDGWHTGKAVDPDGVITKGSYDDIALTAIWKINQYTITFDTEGGSEIAAIKQDYNTAITKPADPVKTGYSFIGWDKEIPATMPAQDVTITAKWQINQYTITFDTNGGSEISAIKQDYNTAITKPADPVKTGYTFKGWDNDIPSNMPDQDLSFKAQWQINKYTITFNTDCNIDIEMMELEYGSDVKLPANLERKGFTFLGWDKDIKTMPAENITLTAQWRDDRIAIDAEFNGDVSFPASADNYCNGSEKTVTIDFKITQGEASEFKLSFPNDVISAVNGTIENGEGSIVITIPDNIESGVYAGKVVFVSANPEVYRPLESTITITATIPLRNAAVQLYTDMLIVDNHEGIYNAYQWYRNGEALPGATLLYYTEPKFDYNSLYTVKLSGDGKEMMSCPVEWLSTAKALKPSIKVYPNPAKQGENFTLEILNFDEDQNYDIVIFTANGTMVKKISNVEQKTSVTLPSGVYSGSLINGGEKKGFKLIVK